MENAYISVIIPTRNRQKYAIKTIKQIVELKQNIEIIVQDNSDTDKLYQMIKDLGVSEKVKYEYESKVLPFSENYNRAAEQATGRYLCAIGDDDGVLPNITLCAKWMELKCIDVIKPAKDQIYFYPENKNKKKSACLGYGKYTGSYYFSNPESSLISLLNDGGCDYLNKDLPGSYHGLVSMDVMNRIKTITGYYYGGLTPDMYSVVCLSLVPNIRFAIVDYPISLPGVCPSSGSAISDSGKHVGELKEAPHLKAMPDYKWSQYVPQYYSVETIWAETMVYAIKQMRREELIDKYFNSLQLDRHLYINNKPHRDKILNVLSLDAKEYVLDSYKGGERLLNNTLSTILEHAAIKMSGRRKVVRKISDIGDAVDVFNDKLRSQNTIAPWNC